MTERRERQKERDHKTEEMETEEMDRIFLLCFGPWKSVFLRQ